MIEKKLKTCWHKRKLFDIYDSALVEVQIEENYYNIDIENLFSMALRDNRKRRFLFVSKILGKHIPVSPDKILTGGMLLAQRFLSIVYNINLDDKCIIENFYSYKDSKIIGKSFNLPEKILFIGFAETATGLGYSIFRCFSENAEYIHTTREEIYCDEKIYFEEEHSHAVEHNLYYGKSSYLDSDVPIAFVDDEITTGKSVINFIIELNKKFKRKKYFVISILDWRSKCDIDRFRKIENELNIKIINVSLVKGNFIFRDSKVYNKLVNNGNDFCECGYNKSDFKKIYFIDLFDNIDVVSKYDRKYIKETGRFGIKSEIVDGINRKAKKASLRLNKYREGGPTLCLGTGEFIYLPMLISFYMGKDVFFHSTTRSPVLENNKEKYGIKNSFRFESIEKKGNYNYLYNIKQFYYKEVFIFFEYKVDDKILYSIKNYLNKCGIQNIYNVFFTK